MRLRMLLRVLPLPFLILAATACGGGTGGGGSGVPSESEPNDSWSEATAIAGGTHVTFQGTCADDNDVDNFVVPVVAGLYGAHVKWNTSASSYFGFQTYTWDAAHPSIEPQILDSIDDDTGDTGFDSSIPVDGKLYVEATCFDLATTDANVHYTFTLDLP